MNLLSVLLFISANVFAYSLGHDFKGFDDTVLFDIDWRDDFFFVRNFELIYMFSLMYLLQNKPIEDEPLEVTTHTKDRYTCLIPQLETKEKFSESAYTGPGNVHSIMLILNANIK